MNSDVLGDMFKCFFASDLPLRLTGRPEFFPLAFLLVRSLRPQLIIELETSVGDSYVALCEAVQRCNSAATCICIPSKYSDRETLKDFRSYHDAHYSSFSSIEKDTVRVESQPDVYKFSLIHIVSTGSAEQLGTLMFRWLPRLSPSGVALISGKGEFDADPVREVVSRVSVNYRHRVLQIGDWTAIISKQPIGTIRDLLVAPSSDFDSVAKLIAVMGKSLRADYLRKRESDLCRQLASVEESEIGAQIRFGHADLLLGHTWAEKEEFRARLARIEAKDSSSEGQLSVESLSLEESEATGSRDILRQLYRRYVGEDMPSGLRGKELWHFCGRSILDEILAGRKRVQFPSPSQPKISVIVVLRNKADLSVLGVCALHLSSMLNYELIIVDNGSSDETQDLLSALDGVTVIRNDGNPGFGPAVMQAASRASGEFLCLLNNDALLDSEALGISLRVFSERPDTGAVGAEVLLAGGYLQEAGCIIWRDGRAAQYGRGDDPALPQYSFRRPVDYCSGVFLVTPRLLFQSLGGLDHRYAPAYYEDVDYCMKLWTNHKLVIYEPRCVVYHYEGASKISSAAGREGIIENHLRFTSRWRGSLRLFQVEHSDNIIKARIAALSGMRQCLYFFGKLPESSETLASDARFEYINQLLRHRFVVTCMYDNKENATDVLSCFPIDVELRGLNMTSTKELDEYCSASDLIILAPLQAQTLLLNRIADKYSDKCNIMKDLQDITQLS